MMTNKRLDNIELQLTPKQWAIRLADDMRRHRSEMDFLKAIAKGTFRESPFAKPLFMLAQQAKERWPGPDRNNILAANQLHQKLHTEFHALKMLIVDANDTTKSKVEIWQLKIALQQSKLHAMIQQDAFAQTAGRAATWIGRCGPSTGNKEAKRQMVLKELLLHTNPGVVELRLPSLLRNWADKSFMLLIELNAHKIAVQTLQEKYFDNHAILFQDFEAELEATIQMQRDAIALFNEYQKVAACPLSRGRNQESQKAGIRSIFPSERQGDLSINIEVIDKYGKVKANALVDDWVTTATDKGNTDSLAGTGEDEGLIWQTFRKMMGMKS